MLSPKHRGGCDMKRMRFCDSISTILVLFGFGLYGSSCCYGVWTLVYAALGCIIAGAIIALYTQRCPVLPPLSRYDVLFRKENILSALRQRCARGQKRLTAPSFPLCWMHRTCESGDTMKLGLCQMPVTASQQENHAAMRRYVRRMAA